MNAKDRLKLLQEAKTNPVGAVLDYLKKVEKQQQKDVDDLAKQMSQKFAEAVRQLNLATKGQIDKDLPRIAKQAVESFSVDDLIKDERIEKALKKAADTLEPPVAGVDYPTKKQVKDSMVSLLNKEIKSLEKRLQKAKPEKVKEIIEKVDTDKIADKLKKELLAELSLSPQKMVEELNKQQGVLDFKVLKNVPRAFKESSKGRYMSGSGGGGGSGSGLQVESSRPASPTENQMYLITSTNTIEIYYDNDWQILHTLVSDSNAIWEDGENVVWEDGENAVFN